MISHFMVGMFRRRENREKPPAGTFDKTGCLKTLTGGCWAFVVTRKHLLEGPGRKTSDKKTSEGWKRWGSSSALRLGERLRCIGT